MDERTLGATGRTVSCLGLGLAALGRPGYLTLGHGDDLDHDYAVDAMAARAESVLDAAFAAGIRYLDAARSYGRAEDFLGGWLRSREVAQDAVTVGSKWGYTYTADWRVEADEHEVKDHGLATFRRQLPESIERLDAYLGLYQVHSATLDSGILDDPDTLGALAELRERDVAVGFTTSGPHQADVIRRALDVEVDDRRVFDAVQTTWNLLEPSAGTALAEAHEAGLGVIVKEAVANGRLAGRNPTLDPAARDALQQAAPGRSLDAIALAAVLRQDWADVVLSGAATLEDLASNLTALDVVDEIDVEALGALAEPADEYWRIRGELPWN